MRKTALNFVIASMVLSIAACGSSDTTTQVTTPAPTPAPAAKSVDAMDKYTGTWAGCVGRAPNYVKEGFVIDKSDANNGMITFKAPENKWYSDANCAVLSANQPNVRQVVLDPPSPSTFTIVAVNQSTIDGMLVDKVDFFFGSTPVKAIMYASGNSVYLGLSADNNYPSRVQIGDNGWVLTKQ